MDFTIIGQAFVAGDYESDVADFRVIRGDGLS
jgi:hypothetical protein